MAGATAASDAASGRAGLWLRDWRERVFRGDQAELAAWLNQRLDRRYDQSRVSRWEHDRENIPKIVQVVIEHAGIDPRGTAPSPASTPAAALPSTARRLGLFVACVNHKGGVGKTTTVVNLAYLLGRGGRRVLVVDCDPQANATVHFGIDPHMLQLKGNTLREVLFADTVPADLVQSTCDGLVDVLGASPALASADTELLGEANGAMLLRERLEPVRADYDVILLDCPPSLGMLTVSALNLADQVVVVSQTEMLSVLGIPMLLETVAKVRRRANPRLRLLGVLPTLHNARRSLDQQMLSQLHELAAGAHTQLFPPVRDSADYARGVAAGKPTLQMNPAAPGHDAFAAVAEALAAAARAGEATHGA